MSLPTPVQEVPERAWVMFAQPSIPDPHPGYALELGAHNAQGVGAPGGNVDQPPAYDTNANVQLLLACSLTERPLHDVPYEVHDIANHVPNAVILDQSKGQATPTSVWNRLSTRPPATDLLHISAHCSAVVLGDMFDHLGELVILFVNRNGAELPVAPHELRTQVIAHGDHLRLIFLNACNSSYVGGHVMGPGRPPSLRCVIGWDTQVNTRAARAFSNEFYKHLLHPVPAGPKLNGIPTDANAFEVAFNRAVHSFQSWEVPPEFLPHQRARWLVGDPTSSASNYPRDVRLAGVPVCIIPGHSPDLPPRAFHGFPLM